MSLVSVIPDIRKIKYIIGDNEFNFKIGQKLKSTGYVISKIEMDQEAYLTHGLLFYVIWVNSSDGLQMWKAISGAAAVDIEFSVDE